MLTHHYVYVYIYTMCVCYIYISVYMYTYIHLYIYILVYSYRSIFHNPIISHRNIFIKWCTQISVPENERKSIDPIRGNSACFGGYLTLWWMDHIVVYLMYIWHWCIHMLYKYIPLWWKVWWHTTLGTSTFNWFSNAVYHRCHRLTIPVRNQTPYGGFLKWGVAPNHRN